MGTDSSWPARLPEPEIRRILGRRAVIEQAKGILMERFKIRADAAFAVLKRHSHHTNRKIHNIAETLVRTGELPEDPVGR